MYHFGNIGFNGHSAVFDASNCLVTDIKMVKGSSNLVSVLLTLSSSTDSPGTACELVLNASHSRLCGKPTACW